ncbi:PDDEXK nuclease domain-containing protein [Methylomonas lenta]|uniref:PDDEXK nuclease domain-containing protein n=1 Tax=Methylomonas lenta TaxID=980561 RepID=UPI0009FD6ABA|nr:PDDEXK nuclease domain-containing protein [Methylomonas lenta]
MNHVTTFKQLVDSIQTLHQDLTNQIGKAVNIGLTLRNWLIGGYINDYELQGGDRAEYGERLFDELSQALHGISNCNRRQLYCYLRFYRFYPAFVGTLPPQLPLLPALESILQKVGTTSPQSAGNPPLMTRLSYSHFDLLVDIDDATKRSFYEIECLRGNWSVRELKRQIGNLYYERSGLSIDKLKLAELAQQSVEPQALFNIRDPYLFEFLGLKPAEVMSESQLEDQLLGKLQAFLLELGHGFCFESRQKRILLPRSHAPRHCH